MTCNICIETFNNKTRLPVECNYCEFVSCRACSKRYLLDSHENAHCMNCKKEWDLKNLVSKFERSFINKQYKAHTENILIDRERGLMVETQPDVENIIKREKMDKNVRDLKLQQDAINREIQEIYKEINYLNNYKDKERCKFVRKCTYNNCKGFLSTQWKCGICERWSCPDCHDVKGLARDDIHVCNEHTLATAKLLDQDSKVCPKCGTGIFKIDGCDMMFCMDCHTPFSWKTGTIITSGTIHNPHYFEWQRQTSGGNVERNINEIRCGHEIDQHFINGLYRESEKISYIMSEDDNLKLSKRARSIIHIRVIIMDKFRGDNMINDNKYLRISYMRNFITENIFKKELQLRHKKYQKRREFANIFTMFIDCNTEIYYRLFDFVNKMIKKQLTTKYLKSFMTKNEGASNLASSTIPDIQTNLDKTRLIFQSFITEFDTLREYTNQCCLDISLLYKCVRYNINDAYELNTIKINNGVTIEKRTK